MRASDTNPLFFTPLVVVSILLVLSFAGALVAVDLASWEKATAAIVFTIGATLVLMRSFARTGPDSKFYANAPKTRAAFVVASAMISSELAFAVARAVGWFSADGDAGRWTIEWLVIGLVAGSIELFDLFGDRKRKGRD